MHARNQPPPPPTNPPLFYLQLDESVASPTTSGGGESAATTPYYVQLRSVEARVASMGGVPALGACVLPKATLGLRQALKVTASPAAVDIMRGQLEGSGACVLGCGCGCV